MIYHKQLIWWYAPPIFKWWLLKDRKLVVWFHVNFQIWVFPKIWENSQIIHFNRVFHEINHPFWGYPYFWKHPYVQILWYQMACQPNWGMALVLWTNSLRAGAGTWPANQPTSPLWTSAKSFVERQVTWYVGTYNMADMFMFKQKKRQVSDNLPL